MENLGNRTIKSPESKGEVFVPAWIFPSVWNACGETDEDPHCVCWKDANTKYLKKKSWLNATCKDIVVIYNFKESLPSLLHKGKKYQPHAMAFHHDLPEGRDKTLDSDVCVCISFLSDPVLSVFASRCLRPLLVSGFWFLLPVSSIQWMHGAARILWLVLFPVLYCNLRLAQLFVQLKRRTCKTMEEEGVLTVVEN